MSRLSVVAAFARAGKGNSGWVLVRSSCSLVSGATAFRRCTDGSYVAAFGVIERLRNRLGCLGLISILVIDGSHCVGLVGQGAVCSNVGSHEDGRVGRHVGFD